MVLQLEQRARPLPTQCKDVPPAPTSSAPAWIWALAVMQLPFMFVASAPIVLADVWWSLKLGELILRSGSIAQTGALTYTPLADEQINAQWLAQLVYFLSYRMGGLEAVVTLTALCAGLTFGLVFVAGRVLGAPPALAALAALAGFVAASTNLAPRPQTFAYPLAALALVLLLQARRRPVALLGLPALVAFWTNLHGSFPLSVLLVAVFFAGAAVERLPAWRTGAAPLFDRHVLRLAATLAATVAAIGANPYGFGVLRYVQMLSSNPIIRQYVTEWAPTTIGDLTGALFFGSLLAFVGVAYLSSRRMTPTEALLVFTFGALGVQSVRAVAWWGIMMAPILARLAAGLTLPAGLLARIRAANRPVGGSRRLLNLLVAVLWLLALVASLPWLKTATPLLAASKRTVYGEETPLRLAAFLAQTPQGSRMFNYQGWGGYLEWALGPDQRTFVDGRIEVHPPEVYLDYLRASAASADWEAILERYGVDHLVLSRAYQPELIAAARASPHWRASYEDELSVVLVQAG